MRTGVTPLILVVAAGCVRAPLVVEPPERCTCNEARHTEAPTFAAASSSAPKPPPMTEDEAIAFELDLIADIRAARTSIELNDTTPVDEKKLAARSAYAHAIELFTGRVAGQARGLVFDALVVHPSVATDYENALFEAFIDAQVASAKPPKQFVAKFRSAAMGRTEATLEPIAVACTTSAIDARRGKYIAIFNGKL